MLDLLVSLYGMLLFICWNPRRSTAQDIKLAFLVEPKLAILVGR